MSCNYTGSVRLCKGVDIVSWTHMIQTYNVNGRETMCNDFIVEGFNFKFDEMDIAFRCYSVCVNVSAPMRSVDVGRILYPCLL